MFLARIGVACAGCPIPSSQHGAARPPGGVFMGHRTREPSVKVAAVHRAIRSAPPHRPHHLAHVVIGVAGPDDQHTFIAQGRQRATGSKMCLSVEIVAQAQLDGGGDVGLRKSHL